MNRRRDPSLATIFLILVIFFSWIDQSGLPDYEAYQKIFDYSIFAEGWEIFFIFVNVFLKKIGLSYSGFRVFILIFSSVALWLVLSRLQSKKKVKLAPATVVNSFLMFFILAVFMLEYFVIKIRAGFAIGLFFCAIYCLLSPQILLRIFSIIFLVLSFFTHQQTTAILIVFLVLPLAASVYKGSLPRKSWGFFSLTVSSVVYILYKVNSLYILRGEELFSPMNPVRVVMFSIVPLIILFFLRNELNIPVTKKGSIYEFPSYFVRFYIVLALGQGFMFVAGFTAESGEAQQRLYMLSSITALLSFRISGSAMSAPVSSYILVMNALFFLRSVFLPDLGR